MNKEKALKQEQENIHEQICPKCCYTKIVSSYKIENSEHKCPKCNHEWIDTYDWNQEYIPLKEEPENIHEQRDPWNVTTYHRTNDKMNQNNEQLKEQERTNDNQFYIIRKTIQQELEKLNNATINMHNNTF